MVLTNDNMVTWPPFDLHCVMAAVVWDAPELHYASLCVWVCMKMTISQKKCWGKTMLPLIFFRPFYAKKLPMMTIFTQYP